MSFPFAKALTAMPGVVPLDNNPQRNDMGNFAVYTLVPLPDEAGFLRAVNQDDILKEDQVFFPPDYDFTGMTLADICHYHFDNLMAQQKRQEAEEGGRGKFTNDPFFVAIHEDVFKHGVLLVNPSYQFFGSEESVPAVARCPVAQEGQDPNHDISAMSWAVNLWIANMDMYDLLEQDDRTEWPAELPGYKELQEKLKQSGEELKQKAREKYEKLPVRKMRYNVHHIGDPKRNQHHRVESHDYYKQDVGCEDRIATTAYGGVDCRFDRQKNTLDELWEEIRKVHPVNCTKLPQWASKKWSIHKGWVFVFDNNDGMEQGDDTEIKVALVKVKWDDDVQGKTKEELRLIMPELEVVERVKTEDALARMDELAGFERACNDNVSN